MSIKVNTEVLRFVFNRLKLQEGISLGKTAANMDCELIFKVLINANYKQEHDITLTELETTVKRECGTYIAMYVAQKWEEAKKENSFLSVPYSDISHMTIRDIALKKAKNAVI